MLGLKAAQTCPSRNVNPNPSVYKTEILIFVLAKLFRRNKTSKNGMDNLQVAIILTLSGCMTPSWIWTWGDPRLECCMTLIWHKSEVKHDFRRVKSDLSLSLNTALHPRCIFYRVWFALVNRDGQPHWENFYLLWWAYVCCALLELTIFERGNNANMFALMFKMTNKKWAHLNFTE